MALELSIQNISLRIETLTEPSFTRARVSPVPQVDYSIYGAAIGDGPFFEPKHIWAINCLLKQPDMLLLEAIYSEFDRRRRTPPYTGAEVTLMDTNQEFVEKAPKTRAIVPGTTEAIVAGGYIGYFAQFKVWFVKPPEYEENGVFIKTSFALQEVLKAV
jgi:hypothetical protein